MAERLDQAIEKPAGCVYVTKKFVAKYWRLGEIIAAFRAINPDIKVVVTIGSWDLLHVGHVRYLAKAKAEGNLLVVGVDSDAAIKRYKGPLRPMISQEERVEMVSYLSCVDYVTLVDDVDSTGEWQCGLIRAIRADVFVAVEDESYPEGQRKEIEKLCGKLVILPRQAENTSSTIIIQKVVKGNPELLKKLLQNLRKETMK